MNSSFYSALQRCFVTLVLCLAAVLGNARPYKFSHLEVEQTYNGKLTKFNTISPFGAAFHDGVLFIKITPVFQCVDPEPYKLRDRKITIQERGHASVFVSNYYHPQPYPLESETIGLYFDGQPIRENTSFYPRPAPGRIFRWFSSRYVEGGAFRTTTIDTKGAFIVRGPTRIFRLEGHVRSGDSRESSLNYECYLGESVEGPDFSKAPAPSPTALVDHPRVVGIKTSSLKSTEAGKVSSTHLEASLTGEVRISWNPIWDADGFQMRRRGGPVGTPEYSSGIFTNNSILDILPQSGDSKDRPFEYSIGCRYYDRLNQNHVWKWSDWVRVDYALDESKLKWAAIRPHLTENRDPFGEHIAILGDNSLVTTPMQAGTYTFELRCKESESAVYSKNVSITVTPGPPIQVSGTTISLPGHVDSQIHLQASGGVGSLAWSLQEGAKEIPGFVLLDDGTLEGAPFSPEGTYTLPVVIEDESGQQVEAVFTILITPPANPDQVLPDLQFPYIWHENDEPLFVENLVALSWKISTFVAASTCVESQTAYVLIELALSRDEYTRTVYCNIPEKYATKILGRLLNGSGGIVANSAVGKCAWMYVDDSDSKPVRLGADRAHTPRIKRVPIRITMPRIPDRVFVSSLDPAVHAHYQASYGAAYFNLDAWLESEYNKVKDIADIQEKCEASTLYRNATAYFESTARKDFSWWKDKANAGWTLDQIRASKDYKNNWKRLLAYKPGGSPYTGGSLEQTIWSFVDQETRNAGGRAIVRLKNSIFSSYRFLNGDGYFYVCSLPEKMKILGETYSARVRLWVSMMKKQGLLESMEPFKKKAIFEKYRRTVQNVSDSVLQNRLVTVRPTPRLMKAMSVVSNLRRPVRSGLLIFDLAGTGFTIYNARDRVKATVKEIGGVAGGLWGAAEGATAAGKLFWWLNLEPGPGNIAYGAVVTIGGLAGGAIGYYTAKGATGVLYEIIWKQAPAGEPLDRLLQEAFFSSD